MSILVNSDSTVITQGFVGENGAFHSEQGIACRTKLVGRVIRAKGSDVGSQRFLKRASAGWRTAPAAAVRLVLRNFNHGPHILWDCGRLP